MKELIDALLSTERSPLLPEKFDYWKDLIGVWEFDYADGYDRAEQRHVKGEWIFARMLEGLGIIDMFICPSRDTRELNPQPDGEYGVALRVFNPNTQKWDMTYTTRGSMTRLEGDLVDGKVELTVLDAPQFKWVFAERAHDHFYWQNIEVLPDGTRKLNCDVRAKRKI